jgi:glycosyltransferase involved in cell wall biosynthesis
MRIGMVTACYKPVINGVTRMVALYKQHLEAAGYEVTVFTLGEPDPAGEEAGVIRSPGIPLGDTGYYVAAGYNREARKLLGKMDILHCHHLFMGLELAHRYGHCPIVYTNHTRYDLYSNAYMPLPQPAADAVMRQVWPELTDRCDVVITPSESVRDVMLDFGVRQPIEVIENGVDRRLFLQPMRPCGKRDLGIDDTAILGVYVGRLSPEKNLESLLRQFAIAQGLLPDLHLLIIGKGPLEGAVKKLAADLQVNDHVRFTGALPYEEIPNYLAAADFFVTASVTEVHPLTVIEAMAAGLPIAAVASPGISDTVEHGRTGILTRHGKEGLAAALVRLAGDRQSLREMGEAARLASERYDIARTVERTHDLYQRLRRERPDLEREKKHGVWPLGMRPMVDQLAALLRPAESE